MFFALIINLWLIYYWLRLSNALIKTHNASLDYPLFMGIGWFLYSSLFLVEKLFSEKVVVEDYIFAFDSNIAIISMIFGVLCVNMLIPNSKRVCMSYKSKIPTTRTEISILAILIISAMVLGLVIYYITVLFGGFGTYFSQRYGEYLVQGVSSFTMTVPLFCGGYILCINSPFFTRSKSTDIFVLFFSVLLILLFFLGGNRNLSMMLLIAFIWARYYQIQLNLIFILLVILFVVVGGALNAIFREYGISNILFAFEKLDATDITRFIKAISEGEFGTMARVSNYYTEFNFRYLGFGYSYFLDPIVNMIPTALYPNRPDTIAVEFTQQYWGVSKGATGVIGLGFSPIVEAKINFSYFWFLAFVLIGASIRALQKKLLRSSLMMRYIIFGCLAISSLNFFRIDFAIYLKFVLLIFGSCLFILFMLRIIRKFRLY